MGGAQWDTVDRYPKVSDYPPQDNNLEERGTQTDTMAASSLAGTLKTQRFLDCPLHVRYF
jgi:hypothetical protein